MSPVKLDKFSDLLSLEQYPKFGVNISGVDFGIEGGSADTFPRYFTNEAPELLFRAKEKAKAVEKFGHFRFLLRFKKEGFKLVPSKILKA